MPQHHTIHVARGAAALAAAMGIGRFVYTPILPMMTAHAGLGPGAAGGLATANYAGYLLGALAAAVAPQLIRTTAAWRTSLIAVVISLAAMPLTQNPLLWMAIRTIAGFASAVLFVIAVDWMLDHARGRSAQLPGWGFGGVGAGIALSGLLVLALPTSGWRAAWWTAAALAALVSVFAWHMQGAATPPEPGHAPSPRTRTRGRFGVLLLCYLLEGIGYIIAGTFLVAAIAQQSAGGLSSGAWLIVGLAAVPSAALWASAAACWARPTLLVAALVMQAAGIALPALVGGAIPAIVGAVLFGGTFLGVSTLALAEGRALAFPGAVAVLTTGYSAGQIVGPLLVTPLLHHGFRYALITSAVVVSLSALAAGWLRIGTDRSRAATARDRSPALGLRQR
jgi:predicted MFS family arabinose efflux permease